MPHEITQRQLNRATLDRQLLLRRSAMPVFEAVEHLGGLQAQTTNTWYTGLWTRLTGFVPSSIVELMTARKLMRVALMRSTIHLVSADDCLAWRLLVEPVIVRSMKGAFGKKLEGLDVDEAVALGRKILTDEPLTFNDLGKRMKERWPDRDGAAMAQLVRAHAALIQIPPRGLWGRSGLALHTPTESWLGRSVVSEPSPDDLVLRYLAAFGPASVMDAQAWSGMTKLREVFDRLRPQLVTFRAEDGREMFDLPDAPRPDEDTPAPVRFMYDYDNLFLSHKDRSRFIVDDRYKQIWQTSMYSYGTFMVDGVVQGVWRMVRDKPGSARASRQECGQESAILFVHALYGLPDAAVQEELTTEGHALLDFLTDKSSGMQEVRFTTELPPL